MSSVPIVEEVEMCFRDPHSGIYYSFEGYKASLWGQRGNTSEWRSFSNQASQYYLNFSVYDKRNNHILTKQIRLVAESLSVAKDIAFDSLNDDLYLYNSDIYQNFPNDYLLTWQLCDIRGNVLSTGSR